LKEFASKGQLQLEEDARDKSVRSSRSLLDLVQEIGSRGGLAIPTHIDGDGGIASLMNAKSLASLLMSPHLSALEFATKTGLETYFSDVDLDDARREAWLARQQIAELRARGLGRIMSSDAHSPEKVGLDRTSRTLTSPHQLAMPTKNRLRLDKHPAEGRTAHQLAQRRHDRPIRGIQLRPLDLPAYDAKLVPEKKQLRFRVVDSQPHIKQIEEQPKQGVHEGEEHRPKIGSHTKAVAGQPPIRFLLAGLRR
jgi:hypothetical protein